MPKEIFDSRFWQKKVLTLGISWSIRALYQNMSLACLGRGFSGWVLKPIHISEYHINFIKHTLERRLIMLKWLSNYYHCYYCHFGLLILLPLPPTCWGNRCNPLCQAYLVLRTKCRALCMLSKQSTNWVPSSAWEGPDSENLGGCWAGSHRVDAEAQQDVQMMPRGPDLVLHLILWFPSSLFSRLLPSPLPLFSLLQTIATGDQLFLQPSHSLAQQPFELGIF